MTHDLQTLETLLVTPQGCWVKTSTKSMMVCGLYGFLGMGIPFSRSVELYMRPKAALLFWFFGDFRCGALLFMVIYVRYKYKNR